MKVVGKMAIVPNAQGFMDTASRYIKERILKGSKDFGIVWEPGDITVEVIFWSEDSPNWRYHGLEVMGKDVLAPLMVPKRLISVVEGDTVTFNGRQHTFVLTTCQKESYYQIAFEEMLHKLRVEPFVNFDK